MADERTRPTDAGSWDQRYVEGCLPWDSGVADRHLQAVVEAHAVPRGRALPRLRLIKG
jgi:hypothetical protein